MIFSEEQVQAMASNSSAFGAGQKLADLGKWQNVGSSERAIWGEIKGSGKSPYQSQVDLRDRASKCSCPSRQFPCKHGVGLMLAFARSSSDHQAAEPEWVSSWLDKREQKAEKKTENVPKTAEQEAESAKNRAKTQEKRRESVLAGAGELRVWIRDLIRLGLMTFPERNFQEFQRLSARMMDAKAPGLARLVMELAEMSSADPDRAQVLLVDWIARAHLLLRGLQNLDDQDQNWQQSMKAMAGWSESPKELLENSAAPTKVGQWLVYAIETEDQGSLQIRLNHLISESGDRAMFMDVSVNGSAFEHPLAVGECFAAKLIYFPGAIQHRVLIQDFQGTDNLPLQGWKTHENLRSLHDARREALLVNPWQRGFDDLVRDVRLRRQGERFILCDAMGYVLEFDKNVALEVFVKWIAFCAFEPVTLALRLGITGVVPLGILVGTEYVGLL